MSSLVRTRLEERALLSSRLLLLIAFSITLSSLAQLAMKAGMSRPTVTAAIATGDRLHAVVTALLDPFVLLGLSLYGIGAVAWLMVLARVDVSVAYPFVSLGFVLTAGLAAAVLGESITMNKLLGIALVASGVYFIARP